MGVEGGGLVEGEGLFGSNVGGRGDDGYGGCEPRIESTRLNNIVAITKYE